MLRFVREYIMSVSVLWESKGLCIEVQGELDIDELDNKLGLVFPDPRYKNSQYTLFDATNAESARIDTGKLKDLATSFLAGEHRTAEFKFAIVLDDAFLEYSLDEYLSMTASSDRQARTFHTIEAARNWLNE